MLSLMFWRETRLWPHKTSIGKKAIGCKWIFKVKCKPDGFVERQKAWLIINGFIRTHGVDFLDMFSPMVKMTTVRMLLATATTKNWHVHQLDFNTVFLHGDLIEEVYMQVPAGLTVSYPSLGHKL